MSGSPPSSPGGRGALLWLVVTFGMLWVPVGQQAFLHAHWMKVGTFLAPFLVFIAVAFRPAAPARRDLRMLSLALLVAYVAHQFEEHWIDVHGNVYAFHGSVNALLRDATGTGVSALTPAAIFVINTSLVWLVGALAIWRGDQQPFATLAMAAIVIVNAVAHIGLGVASFSYNPGLLTSVVLFVPLAVYVYRHVAQAGRASRREVLASVVWGVLAHVLMVGGLVVANVLRLVPERAYFVALVAWSILPVLMFRHSDDAATGGSEASKGAH